MEPVRRLGRQFLGRRSPVNRFLGPRYLGTRRALVQRQRQYK